MRTDHAEAEDVPKDEPGTARAPMSSRPVVCPRAASQAWMRSTTPCPSQLRSPIRIHARWDTHLCAYRSRRQGMMLGTARVFWTSLEVTMVIDRGKRVAPLHVSKLLRRVCERRRVSVRRVGGGREGRVHDCPEVRREL